MISSQYPPVYGGAGKQAELLGQELASRGWAVTVVTLDQDAKGSSSDSGVQVIRVLKGSAATGAKKRLLTTVGLGLAAAKHVLFTRPTAVHVHGAYWWSIPPLVAARLVGSRSVVKVTRDGEDDPGTVMNRKVAGWLPIGKLYGISFAVADHVVTLSADAYQSARKYLPQHGKVMLVRNGVDIASLGRNESRRSRARMRFKLSPDTKVTTFVGYLVEHKGVLDLLAAWEKRGTLVNDELWLVGPYDGFYRELTAHARERVELMQEQGFNIRLFGKVDAKDMPEIYWASDVFTLPSYAEGMPNSLAEAIVAGCEIVATEIPGITDIVNADRASLVRPGDVDALADALLRAQNLTAKADIDAAADLGIQRTADIVEELYAPHC
jgi:glycosyltransferase involved in cell wall biosynthesis